MMVTKGSTPEELCTKYMVRQGWLLKNEEEEEEEDPGSQMLTDSQNEVGDAMCFLKFPSAGGFLL